MGRTIDPVSKSQRDKGKRGEREVVALFKAMGFDARRTSQVDGTLSADVIVEGVPLHVEVKRRAKIAALRFMDQAEAEANGSDLPVVFMREDGGPEWSVMLQARDFLNLLLMTTWR